MMGPWIPRRWTLCLHIKNDYSGNQDNHRYPCPYWHCIFPSSSGGMAFVKLLQFGFQSASLGSKVHSVFFFFQHMSHVHDFRRQQSWQENPNHEFYVGEDVVMEEVIFEPLPVWFHYHRHFRDGDLVTFDRTGPEAPLTRWAPVYPKVCPEMRKGTTATEFIGLLLLFQYIFSDEDVIRSPLGIKGWVGIVVAREKSFHCFSFFDWWFESPFLIKNYFLRRVYISPISVFAIWSANGFRGLTNFQSRDDFFHFCRKIRGLRLGFGCVRQLLSQGPFAMPKTELVGSSTKNKFNGADFSGIFIIKVEALISKGKRHNNSTIVPCSWCSVFLSLRAVVLILNK